MKLITMLLCCQIRQKQGLEKYLPHLERTPEIYTLGFQMVSQEFVLAKSYTIVFSDSPEDRYCGL